MYYVIFYYVMTFVQGQEMTLTLNTHDFQVTKLLEIPEDQWSCKRSPEI